MARKVFISFLGTNNYLDTHYELGGRQSSLVRFIQEALLELAFNDWTSDDHIYIFGTDGDEGSYKKNWLDNGQSDKNGPIIQPGLKTQLTNMGLKTPFDFEFIPEGFSSDDVWKMMEIITGKLEQGDEIHLDVTHAFRSIPMLATTLFNYTQFMLGTTLASVHYGAFEKLGPRYKVEKIPEEDRIAPIIDMTDIVLMQDFTDAASNLKQFGSVKKLGAQVAQSGLKAKRAAINELTDAINQLDESISINRLNNIKKGEFKKKFDSRVETVKKHSPSPLKNLITELEQELSNFSPEEDNKNIEEAIEFALRHDMLQQALTMSREYILIRLGETLSELLPIMKFSSKKKTARVRFQEYLSSLLSITDEDLANRNYKSPLAEYSTITEYMLGQQTILDLRAHYTVLGKARNSINHGKGDKSRAELLEIVKSEYPLCKECITLPIDITPIIKGEVHGSEED